jgi:hypothetical protein
VTDDDVDAALHEIGRHLGVEYDEDGYAKPSTAPPMMISTRESLALYAEVVRELQRAEERARKRSRFHLVK